MIFAGFFSLRSCCSVLWKPAAVTMQPATSTGRAPRADRLPNRDERVASSTVTGSSAAPPDTADAWLAVIGP